MGLLATDLQMLRGADRDFRISRVLTVGRQNLYLQPTEVEALRSAAKQPSAFDAYQWGDFAENVIRGLTGAEEVHSIDASDFEDATFVHDMNERLESMDERYDLVIDGGTLEHVFNFPVAISNIMRVVKTGGYVLTANPANNLCGHGFYQFTPELMFRVFGATNGFRVVHMLLTEHRFASVEMSPPTRIVEVIDPEVAQGRIMVVNNRPLMLRMLARKEAPFAQFAATPQQSDYARRWSDAGADAPGGAGGVKGLYRRIVPAKTREKITAMRTRYGLQDKRFFKAWRPER